MIFKEKIQSKIDFTIKYSFLVEGLIVEFSYIDNGTGKDIICVPCQTMCHMACKFCHCTDYIGEIGKLNLKSHQIIEGIFYIISDLSLNSNKTLLVSYMGLGEPMENVDEIINSMQKITEIRSNVRFGLATCLPKYNFSEFFRFTELVNYLKLPVKLHLSLHYTRDQVRNEWMPAALNIVPSIKAIEFYYHVTGNPVEIHYTLIDGINDSQEDAISLEELLRNNNFIVKILHFNEKESSKFKESKRIDEFRGLLGCYDVFTEYYIPPGLDIGASCGQFIMNKYERNN